MLISQILSVAGADDLGARIMTEEKGGKCDGCTVGLERAGRHIDDQPSDLTSTTALELGCDKLNMPIAEE